MTQLKVSASICTGFFLTTLACVEKDRHDAATPASLSAASQLKSALQSPTSTPATAIGVPGGTTGDGGVALGGGGGAGHGGSAGRGGTQGTGSQR